jgi:hypothetical protein
MLSEVWKCTTREGTVGKVGVGVMFDVAVWEAEASHPASRNNKRSRPQRRERFMSKTPSVLK